jgi:ribosomal RNA assembly protein
MKPRLEKKLKVKIETSGRKIEVQGEEYNRFIAEQVFEALDKNFSVDVALLLLNEDYVFEEIPIKEFTRKKDLTRVKARIIGKKGRTIEVLGELSDCYLTLSDNQVNVIGPAEKIKDVENAITNLIHGSKTAKVYGYLEKARKREKEKPRDLGLKIKRE